MKQIKENSEIAEERIVAIKNEAKASREMLVKSREASDEKVAALRREVGELKTKAALAEEKNNAHESIISTKFDCERRSLESQVVDCKHQIAVLNAQLDDARSEVMESEANMKDVFGGLWFYSSYGCCYKCFGVLL